MRHTAEKTIDGDAWRVNEFSATEGLRLLATLTKLAAAPVAKAAEALPRDGSVLDATLDFSLLGSAVADFATRLDPEEFAALVKRLLKCTWVKVAGNGKFEEVMPQFDVLFQGRYITLFKVLGFVLETNFKLPLADWLAAASVGAGEPEKTAAAG